MEPQAPKRHRLRRILAILAMIVLAAWLGLRNDGLRTQLVNRALAAINPWPDTRLSAATTSGSVLHSLNLFDVTLVRDDGSMALRIDTVEASWSLLPLLRRDIRLGAIRGTGLTIAPRRAADGSLDLLVPFQGDGDPSKWTIGIAELHVTESRLVIEDTLGGTWSADHLALVMTDFSSGNLLHLRVDTLGTELHDPVTGLPGSLSARFELTDGLIRLDTLSLSTPRSSVFGSGMLRLGQDSPFPDSARGTLSMGPLALADLVGLYPSLNPEGILSGQVVLGGTEALWTAEADLVLSAGSLPPGSLIARATWQPDGEAFTGRVDATGVGPAHLLADQSRQDRFDAVVIADLVGSRADSLSGTSRLEVTRGSMGGFTLVGEIDQIWTAGTIALDGAGRSGATAATTAAAWTLGGTISPFGPEPTYNLRLNVPRLAMQSLAPDSHVDASVAVGLTVSGTGFSRDASVDARLLVTGGHLAECRVGPGEIVAILRAETVRITADLPACNGGLDAAGRLSMDGSWTIGSLNLMNVDGALALADASGSLVSARIHGEGSFAGAGRGTLEWTADSLRWGPNRLDALAGRLRYRGSVWGADAEARVDSGLVRLAADGTRNAARLTDLTVDRLDLSAVMGDPAYRTRLTGRGDGQFERANGADWTGSVDLAIAGSRIVEQEITSGSVRAVLGGGGRIDLVSGLEWPGGRADVKADLLPGQGEATPATIRITRFDFEGVDAGAFAGLTNLETRLAGSATGHVTLGSTGPETRLDVTFVPGTTINGVPVGQATVTASTGPDRIVASIKARLGGDSRGRLFADLNLAGMGTTPTYTMDVRLDSVDFGRLVGLDSVATSLTMRGHIDGSGFEPGSASFSFRVDSLVGRWRDLTVGDLVARGAWRAGLLQLDTLSTTGSFGHIEAHGGLPILRTADPAAGSANLTLAAALKDVGPIFEAAGIPGVHTAGGRIDLTVAGTAERLSANAAGSVDGLAWGDLHVATAKAVLSVETGTSMPRMQSALRVDASVLSTPRTTADALVLDARANGDSLTVSSTVDFSAGRRASFDVVTNTGLTRVLANRLDLDLDGTSWRLSTPATAEREGDGIRFSPVILDAGESRLVVSGLVSLHNPDFSVAATRVRLDAVADLLGYRGFGLVIDGSFVALGQDVGGTIEADVTSYGGPPVHLSLQTTYLDRKLSLDGLLRNEEGQTATIAGFLTIPEDRVAGQALPVELTVTADAFPIDWTRPFFDRELLDEVGGAITGTLTISGTFYDPDLGGSMRLERGRIGIVTLGRPGNSMKYTDITADLAFSGVTIQIITASLRSGPGRMNATGTIELTQLTFGAIDLQLRSQDFLAIDDEVYRAFVDADLHLSGTTRRPVLGGRVLVSRGDFRMSEESAADAFAPISLSTADLLTIERRFGLRVSEADTSTFVFYEALAIEDMRLEFDRDAWMRSSSNPKMDIQFTGNLDVRKSPHAEPTVYGDISVIPENSRIEQFGRRFNIERGNLTFTGPPTEPEIDLAGLYRVPSRGTGTDEVTIRLLATGRLDDLRVTFDSDPAMELADVISYIATGRPASGSLQFGGSTGTSYLSTAAGLAVGPISSLMEEFALAGLGLDVVEIENDGIRGLTLTVGKYVSPDFFVSVSQPIALSGSTESSNQGQDRSTQVTMEYEIVRQVLLSLLNRGSVLRINLRWEYAF